MQLRYHFFESERVLIIQCQKELTLKHFEETLITVIRHPKFTRRYDIIVDLRLVDNKLNRDDFDALVTIFRDYPHPNRRVALVCEGPIMTAYGYLFSRKARKPNVSVFSTLEGASNWLGFDSAKALDYFDPTRQQ
jgi:hypothetical protein